MIIQPRPTYPTFALIIGISDYSAYDASLQKQRGESDLRGGKNDALAFYRICRELGVAPKDIHVLMSPAFDASDTGHSVPGYVGLATRQEIEAQIGWLAQKLAHAPSERYAPSGLLCFSGHGDFSGDDLALCPGDVRSAGAGKDLENVLGFDRIEEILRSYPGAVESLTVLLDASHAGADKAWGPGRRASLTGRGKWTPGRPPRTLARSTILAANPGEVARTMMVGGRAHGALTWALFTVASTWRSHSDRRSHDLSLSQGDLVGRAQTLLQALSVPQTITLQGGKDAAERSFFHRREVPSTYKPLRPVEPSNQADPDVERWDFTLYTLRLTIENELLTAQVLSVGNASTALGYDAGTEYWELTEEFIEAVSEGDSLEIVSQGGDWPSPAAEPPGWSGSSSSPQKDAQVSWTSLQQAPSGALFASGQDRHYAIRFSGTPSSPVVEWFICAEDQPATGTYVVDPSGLTFTPSAPQTGQGMVWFVGDDA